LPSAQREKEYNRHNESEADQSDYEPGETSVRELSHQEREMFKTRTPGSQGSVWKYIGVAILLVVFISFLVFLSRNAQHIHDDEI
jgi:uncharacterized membrane protein